ncbi:hypothetical protein MYX76_13480 [Desulfobacterota bacterium AH_259_B03_O07]|nr:hypothetical protein [Desulfobacterota bacterium AH_259_B03_O07]
MWKVNDSNSTEPALEWIYRLSKVLQANIRAILSYVPRTFPGKINLITASEQVQLNPQDPTMGWDKLASEGVELSVIPGNHFTLLKEPRVKLLAEQLTTYFNTVNEDHEMVKTT